MTYENMLRKRFQGVDLGVEDFYLLEGYQIAYLPDRVPQQEFAAVMWGNAAIKRFLIAKHPPISSFIEDCMTRFPAAASQQELDAYSDRLTWEIADQFIYVKHPDVYDKRLTNEWDFGEATSNVPMENKTVIDAGAGTGRVAFAAAKFAHLVFAVEPATAMRQYMRAKASRIGVKNLFALDGFLHAIPLPDNFADTLITSNAIGWQLEDELIEIERVVKKGGYAIHLSGYSAEAKDPPLHSVLISYKCGYTCARYKDKDGWKRKYWKQI